MNASALIKDYSFIPLESSDESLIGVVDQVEIHGDRIYLLDGFRLFNVFAFGKDGKFIQKFENRGNGPGEFIQPYSFWVDGHEYIYVLDRQLSRLQRYKLENFEYVDEITMPGPSPISYVKLSDEECFFYYFPWRMKDPFNRNNMWWPIKEGMLFVQLLKLPIRDGCFMVTRPTLLL